MSDRPVFLSDCRGDDVHNHPDGSLQSVAGGSISGESIAHAFDSYLPNKAAKGRASKTA
jgi:hypothetical protein